MTGHLCDDHVTLARIRSFSNAETAEDAVEQVLAIDRAGHFAELRQGYANLGRD